MTPVGHEVHVREDALALEPEHPEGKVYVPESTSRLDACTSPQQSSRSSEDGPVLPEARQQATLG